MSSKSLHQTARLFGNDEYYYYPLLTFTLNLNLLILALKHSLVLLKV